MKQLYFTVTNDLSYDQRMHRICGSLAAAGYSVTLVGRRLRHSLPLPRRSFDQKRLRCFFHKGPLFYAEYNLRLFFFLLFRRMDGLCAIDLDTILPCLFLSKLKGVPRLYDAHEYFTELKEVRTRPAVQRAWLAIERFAVPRFSLGYTVSEGLAGAFRTRYGRNYQVIRNMPLLQELPPVDRTEQFLLYQGAVNEARGFEYLIPAMTQIPLKLVICGDGNYMEQLKALIREHGVAQQVELTGMLPPEQLFPIACRATLGIGLAEKEGLNQYFALPNKFFDYLHAGLPQVAMDYPEYRLINNRYKVALLLDNLSPDNIARAITGLLADPAQLEAMRRNCLQARLDYHWEKDEEKLVALYRSVFGQEMPAQLQEPS